MCVGEYVYESSKVKETNEEFPKILEITALLKFPTNTSWM